MNDKQFKTICKKLDKIVVITAIQSIEDRDKKILMMKRAGFDSLEIGELIGVDGSVIRKSKNWTGKKEKWKKEKW